MMTKKMKPTAITAALVVALATPAAAQPLDRLGVPYQLHSMEERVAADLGDSARGLFRPFFCV
jgi:hypothetical protein